MKDIYNHLYLIMTTIFILKILVFFIDRAINKIQPHYIAIIKCTNQKRREKWVYILAITSFLHSVYGFIAGMVVLNNIGFRGGYKYENTDIEVKYICISFSYFIFDTLMGFYTNTNDFVMNIHHIQTISSLFYVLAKGKYINEVVWSLTYAEASGIFLQAMIILKKHDFKKIYGITIGICFAFIFFYMRLFVMRRQFYLLAESDASFCIKFLGAQIRKLKSICKSILELFNFQSTY